MAGGRKEYEMLFQLNAQLGGSYSGTFSKAQSQVAAMQKEITALSKTQSNISAYQKQQTALEATRQKLLALQQQYDNIQKEISETEGYSSTLENRLLSKQQQIEKTTASIDKQTQSLQQMGDALDAAGIDLNDLDKESARLTSEMDGLRQQQVDVQESAERMGTAGMQAIQAYQQALVASGIQDALKSIFEEIKACTDASVEFESGLTGVDKTTDLTASELAEMSSAVKDLALDIPVTTDEMLAIGEVAGQLGIAKGNILDFSTTMSMLSTATTMAADEGATMLAQFANITQMDQSMYDELASSIVALGNTYATTEQKITEMSTGIAASASLAGMSEADMLGLSAAVSSLGIETQMGSTAVSKMISMLMTAVETGDGLEELANVAGMSADQFADAWGNNAAGALERFVVGLSDTDRLGQSAIVTLNDLGITETRMQRTILSLSNSGNLLTRTIATANQAWYENIALSDEAAKRYATTASQQVLMENAFNNLRIAVGDNYIPALRTLYGVTKDAVAGMTDFVETNPGLVKAFTATVGVIGLVTAALTAYTAVVKIAKAATGLLTSVIPGVGPIMAVTAGIAALTGVVVGLSNVTETEAQSVRELTEASREDYYQLQELRSEYEAAAETYGDNSEQAQLLAWQIERLNDSYENGKQTIGEYVDENNNANESMYSMLQANRDAYNEIDANEGMALALVNRLQELATQTDQTVESQEEMKAIISELNGVVPELALSYEDVIGGVTDYAAAIDTAVKAQAAAQRYEANQQYMVAALNERYDAQQRLNDAIDQQKSAKERLTAAEKAYNDYLTKNSANPDAVYTTEFTDLKSEYEAAEQAFDTYTAAIEENQAAVSAADAEYQRYLDEQVAYVKVTTEATAGTTELTDRINATRSEMEALAEAYTEAYNAAYESVSGQYSLWDKASTVVATSAYTINSAIDSQITYWQDYNSNLTSLGDRSKDIEGLSDMIASFADGSTESVKAIAGMSAATDEELTAMVADWQILQEEQKAVSESIAELTNNFTAEMDRLQSELAADIEAMNLSEEAASSGRSTIQGFINAANQMLPQVQSAYQRIANAARAALSSVGSGGTGFGSSLPGYASGTRNADRGFAIVGENGPELIYFNGGEQVLTADETAAVMDATDIQLMTFAPQLISALSGYRTNATDAVSSYTPAPTSIQVTFQIGGDATPEVLDALDRYGDEFAERVLAVVEEAGIDAIRRSY